MSVSVEVIPWKDPLPGVVLAKWRELVHGSSNPRAALQAPEWVDYRWRSCTPTFLALLRDAHGALVGITPLAENTYPLCLSTTLRRFGTLHVPGLFIVGNEPLIPDCSADHECLVNGLLALPGVESVQMEGVRHGTPFWSFLQEARHGHRDWMIYFPKQSSDRYRWIELPASYEEYLQRFNRKERRNSRQEMAILERHAGSRLELVRVTQPEQVEEFLRETQIIADNSWQRRWMVMGVDQPAPRQEFLEAMARTGALKCYVLKAGECSCAYALGFQINGVYCFHETAYHEELARFSCGRSMLHLMIKDLFEFDQPRILYFGPGDTPHKRWFANRSGEESTLLVVKKSPMVTAKIRAHAICRRAVDTIFKRPNLPSTPTESTGPAERDVEVVRRGAIAT